MKLKFFIIFLIVFSITFIVGLVILLVFPTILHQQISELLPLRQNELIYEQWQNPTLPVHMQFWYFNVVNPLEVKNGAKPYLKQVGPYTYQEKRIKENITFFENGTVSYYERRYFYFDRSLSVGSENDTITTLNIPLLVIAEKINSLPETFKFAIEIIVKTFEKSGIFMEISVKNLTWGYQDPFLVEVNKIASKFHIHVDTLIGLFVGKNDTTDGVYNVISGRSGVDNFLEIKEWKFSNHLNIWNTPWANMINGTDGSMFPPFLNIGNDHNRIYAFQSDLCRAIYADFVSSDVTIEGIPGYSYKAPSSLFANHTVNPDNIGFCLNGVCLGSGVLNMSKCITNAPIIMSQPHFYQADPLYTSKIDGLSPDASYATQLIMEPNTGLPLHLQKKLQVNIAVKPVKHFSQMDNLEEMFLPLIWLNESAKIDANLSAIIRSKLILPITAAKWISLTLIAVSCILALLLTFLFLLKRTYMSNIEMKPLIKKNPQNEQETNDTVQQI